jgi:hypothetical protein
MELSRASGVEEAAKLLLKAKELLESQYVKNAEVPQRLVLAQQRYS